MATNLAIDDRLIVEAQKVGGHKSKKETVTQALTEYINHHKQQKILGLFNTLDWDPKYDYKARRKRL
jgi:Arc/MetJ family transcription regulator